MPPRRQHNQRPVFALMHNWERVSMNEILAAFSMVMTGAILLAALYFLPDASTSLFNRSISDRVHDLYIGDGKFSSSPGSREPSWEATAKAIWVVGGLSDGDRSKLLSTMREQESIAHRDLQVFHSFVLIYRVIDDAYLKANNDSLYQTLMSFALNGTRAFGPTPDLSPSPTIHSCYLGMQVADVLDRLDDVAGGVVGTKIMNYLQSVLDTQNGFENSHVDRLTSNYEAVETLGLMMNSLNVNKRKLEYLERLPAIVFKMIADSTAPDGGLRSLEHNKRFNSTDLLQMKPCITCTAKAIELLSMTKHLRSADDWYYSGLTGHLKGKDFDRRHGMSARDVYDSMAKFMFNVFGVGNRHKIEVYNRDLRDIVVAKAEEMKVKNDDHDAGIVVLSPEQAASIYVPKVDDEQYRAISNKLGSASMTGRIAMVLRDWVRAFLIMIKNVSDYFFENVIPIQIGTESPKNTAPLPIQPSGSVVYYVAPVISRLVSTSEVEQEVVDGNGDKYSFYGFDPFFDVPVWSDRCLALGKYVIYRYENGKLTVLHEPNNEHVVRDNCLSVLDVHGDDAAIDVWYSLSSLLSFGAPKKFLYPLNMLSTMISAGAVMIAGGALLYTLLLTFPLVMSWRYMSLALVYMFFIVSTYSLDMHRTCFVLTVLWMMIVMYAFARSVMHVSLSNRIENFIAITKKLKIRAVVLFVTLSIMCWVMMLASWSEDLSWMTIAPWVTNVLVLTLLSFITGAFVDSLVPIDFSMRALPDSSPLTVKEAQRQGHSIMCMAIHCAWSISVCVAPVVMMILCHNHDLISVMRAVQGDSIAFFCWMPLVLWLLLHGGVYSGSLISSKFFK